MKFRFKLVIPVVIIFFIASASSVFAFDGGKAVSDQKLKTAFQDFMDARKQLQKLEKNNEGDTAVIGEARKVAFKSRMELVGLLTGRPGRPPMMGPGFPPPPRLIGTHAFPPPPPDGDIRPDGPPSGNFQTPGCEFPGRPFMPAYQMTSKHGFPPPRHMGGIHGFPPPPPRDGYNDMRPDGPPPQDRPVHGPNGPQFPPPDREKVKAAFIALMTAEMKFQELTFTGGSREDFENARKAIIAARAELVTLNPSFGHPPMMGPGFPGQGMKPQFHPNGFQAPHFMNQFFQGRMPFMAPPPQSQFQMKGKFPGNRFFGHGAKEFKGRPFFRGKKPQQTDSEAKCDCCEECK